ncbi:unnamed protein product [Linum trigynum]|uniref:Uncharacterized protein n=1 Tax=Linum trigynum TaxID=586398 RepID=A0AAV2G4L9_9ROSI
MRRRMNEGEAAAELLEPGGSWAGGSFRAQLPRAISLSISSLKLLKVKPEQVGEDMARVAGGEWLRDSL